MSRIINTATGQVIGTVGSQYSIATGQDYIAWCAAHAERRPVCANTLALAKPSTRLGNAVGFAMRAGAWVFDYILPLAVIRAYWLIPARARGALFGGPSASRAAYAAIREMRSGGWQVIGQIAMNSHPPRPNPGS